MNICAFAGSANPNDKRYVEVARDSGTQIARRDHNLVYGGSRLGLMGVISKAVKDAGGYVIGIIPEMFKYLAEGENELIIVSDFNQRLREMESRSDAFIALPGGIGCLYEIFDVLQNRQVNNHTKPLILLNTLGFYNNLRSQLERAITDGFIPEENRGMWYMTETPSQALDYIEQYKPSKMPDKIGFAQNS